MSLKLKLSLGVLLLIAGFLVVRLGLFFKHSVQTATTTNIENKIAGVSETNWSAVDTDNDGIPDTNEAYYRTDPSNPATDRNGVFVREKKKKFLKIGKIFFVFFLCCPSATLEGIEIAALLIWLLKP